MKFNTYFEDETGVMHNMKNRINWHFKRLMKQFRSKDPLYFINVCYEDHETKLDWGKTIISRKLL